MAIVEIRLQGALDEQLATKVETITKKTTTSNSNGSNKLIVQSTPVLQSKPTKSTSVSTNVQKVIIVARPTESRPNPTRSSSNPVSNSNPTISSRQRSKTRLAASSQQQRQPTQATLQGVCFHSYYIV